MLFIVHGLDKPDTGLRAQHLDAHRSYMAAHPIKIVSSGPLVSDDGSEMLGSLLVIEADSRAEIDAFLADEPMAQAGTYQSLTVTAWFQRVGAFVPTAD